MIDKITSAIDEELQRIGCSKLSLPLMQSSDLWSKTGRLAEMKNDIYTCHGMVLAPTAEEEITRTVAEAVQTHRQLPIRLYQVGAKFRREGRPRAGLMRTREFLMKDLYTFDADLVAARQTFSEVCAAYRSIFKRLQVPVLEAEADTGAMGGLESREYHLVGVRGGEDILYKCAECDRVFNGEVTHSCAKEHRQTHSGLELGHAFLLGDRYSTVLKALFTNESREKVAMQMGCFGIGISRLMAAIAEVHNANDGLVWPRELAPFQLSIVFDDPDAEAHIPRLASLLPRADLFVDDRSNMSIGRKLKDSLLIGVPRIIVFGSSWKASGQVEYHDRLWNKLEHLSLDDLSVRIGADERQ